MNNKNKSISKNKISYKKYNIISNLITSSFFKKNKNYLFIFLITSILLIISILFYFNHQARSLDKKNTNNIANNSINIIDKKYSKADSLNKKKYNKNKNLENINNKYNKDNKNNKLERHYFIKKDEILLKKIYFLEFKLEELQKSNIQLKERFKIIEDKLQKLQINDIMPKIIISYIALRDNIYNRSYKDKLNNFKLISYKDDFLKENSLKLEKLLLNNIYNYDLYDEFKKIAKNILHMETNIQNDNLIENNGNFLTYIKYYLVKFLSNFIQIRNVNNNNLDISKKTEKNNFIINEILYLLNKNIYSNNNDLLKILKLLDMFDKDYKEYILSFQKKIDILYHIYEIDQDIINYFKE